MKLSPYAEGLRRELGALTRFAPDEVVRLAEQLGEALDSSVRLTLLEVLSDAAAEITERLEATVVDVRLSGGEPDFVVTPIELQPNTVPSELLADEAGTARVTLRLSEALKAKVEARAAATGISVNAWLVRAAVWALEDSGGSGSRGGPPPFVGPPSPFGPRGQREPRNPGPRRGPGSGGQITGYARS
ncbi:MAG TPA: toxin-antitoxin system HicB family antitoxin [Streptosporangiaceae bacterium]|nr:toxin-antitoxin system HicB family antitoxin [Streptosporangiaceae bacterium]